MSGLGVLTQIVQDARETVRVSLFTIGVERRRDPTSHLVTCHESIGFMAFFMIGVNSIESRTAFSMDSWGCFHGA